MWGTLHNTDRLRGVVQDQRGRVQSVTDSPGSARRSISGRPGVAGNLVDDVTLVGAGQKIVDVILAMLDMGVDPCTAVS